MMNYFLCLLTVKSPDIISRGVRMEKKHDEYDSVHIIFGTKQAVVKNHFYIYNML
jgi:NADH:ubiquinone oxidoreductase subunit 3 (subunit A)